MIFELSECKAFCQLDRNYILQERCALTPPVMGNMRFPRQSRAVAHMNGNPLRTQVPASARYAAPPAGFCVAFLMKPRERERGSNSFRFYNLAFLHAVKSSVRDDKLQFGERSSEILTRASSKPLYQLQNDIFISQ